MRSSFRLDFPSRTPRRGKRQDASSTLRLGVISPALLAPLGFSQVCVQGLPPVFQGRRTPAAVDGFGSERSEQGRGIGPDGGRMESEIAIAMESVSGCFAPYEAQAIRIIRMALEREPYRWVSIWRIFQDETDQLVWNASRRLVNSELLGLEGIEVVRDNQFRGGIGFRMRKER
jgi:hypothetical protein